MKLLLMMALSTFAIAASSGASVPWAFRPPAVPLITHDPYFSIWSMSDRLTDEWPKHWTGANQALCGLVRIDGKPYRFLGPQPAGVADVPAMQQTNLRITPTRSIATFTAAGIELTVTFCSPLLPGKLDILSRPLTYITTDFHSTDGKPHAASVYLDLCAEVAVDSPDQAVDCARLPSYGQSAPCEPIIDPALLRVGTHDQPTLKRTGDGTRIDWGYAYLAADIDHAISTTIGNAADVRSAFAEHGQLPPPVEIKARKVRDGWPVLAVVYDIASDETVEKKPASRKFMVAYDEGDAVQYLGKPLLPYWKKTIPDATQLVFQAESYYESIVADCAKFDDSVMHDLTEAGGAEYAQLCALAYREAIAGHGLALSPDGRPFMFAKENSSNGCIATVDVIYPAAPIFLLFSPTLMEANLAPVMEYADSSRWKFNFAPHDLGTYPRADGQVYGGGEKTEIDQMPVEESANMLILIAALEKATGKPSPLVAQHKALLHRWADYLVDKGLDPENQLCTDDFTGHLAHNVNLSAKAIIAIAAYGKIAHDPTYIDKANAMAAQWIRMSDDGDHTRLAFDKPHTWSQKYNLVWDKVLDLRLFPQSLLEREAHYYLSKSNKFGPPLDDRAAFAKLDWTSWSACLSDDPKTFRSLVDPLYEFANETPDRVPLTDWYQTDTGKHKVFRARPVVGGLFMKMLCEDAIWNKWATGKMTR